MSYCSNCGAPINNDAANFCPTCGARLASPGNGAGQHTAPIPTPPASGHDSQSYGNQNDSQSGSGAGPNGPQFNGTMTRAEMKTLAKQQLSGHWGQAIGVGLVAALILGAAATVTWGIAALILTGVLYFGVTGFFMQVIRGRQDIRFATMFSGFDRFGQTCLAGVLLYVFIALWSLLLVIPGIIKTYAYAMTYYILQDNPDMKGIDAITASRQMMNGHKWDLFVLHLSFIGWFLLSSLTFGILQICYVAPYLSATTAAFYDNLKAQQVQAQSTAA